MEDPASSFLSLYEWDAKAEPSKKAMRPASALSCEMPMHCSFSPYSVRRVSKKKQFPRTMSRKLWGVSMTLRYEERDQTYPIFEQALELEWIVTVSP